MIIKPYIRYKYWRARTSPIDGIRQGMYYIWKEQDGKLVDMWRSSGKTWASSGHHQSLKKTASYIPLTIEEIEYLGLPR